MNTRHNRYRPYRNLHDAIFDIQQTPVEIETVDRLRVAHNETVTVLEEFQQRYEQLSTQEKHRVNTHLRNVYEILGLGPGQQLEEGQNYFQLFQFLLTTANDHTVRIGRLEQLMEQVLAGHPPTTHYDIPTEILYDVKHENRQVSQSVSQSVNPSVSHIFQSVSQFKPSGRPTDGRVAAGEYDEYIRLCRKGKIPVQEIAIELGISKSGVERRITRMKQRGVL